MLTPHPSNICSNTIFSKARIIFMLHYYWSRHQHSHSFPENLNTSASILNPATLTCSTVYHTGRYVERQPCPAIYMAV
jgi:hypothetical protein